MPMGFQKRCPNCGKLKDRHTEFDRRLLRETTMVGAPVRYQWATYCRECCAQDAELATHKWHGPPEP
jgi:hypothetical protein